MTTPGGQLTPGDDTTPPVYGVPDGAYVGDASSPNAVQQLSHMTEASAKAAMRTPIGPSFTAQRDGIWGFFNSILSIVQGGINLVVGAVDAVVNGIKAIFTSVGSLFGMSSRDMSAVDAARVAAENAIVDNLGDALDQLDEIQRAGGAYMDYPRFKLSQGGKTPHVLPLSEPMTLQEGTQFRGPISPLTHPSGHTYDNTEANYARMATGSGYLELLEPGFWRIDFHASVLQAASYYAEPAEVWCYVTSSSNYFPLGPPQPGMTARDRLSGISTQHDDNGYNRILAFGRASAYVDQLETGWSGGNTIAGSVFALLPSGGYKVSMACSAFEHFSGGASTFVMATKINSQSLRDDIEALKVQIAAALPGNSVPLDLDEASIAAMITQAEAIEVPDVEVPGE